MTEITATIKVRRGLKVDLPPASLQTIGELRYATDTKELYIDGGTSNILLSADFNTIINILNQKVSVLNERLNYSQVQADGGNLIKRAVVSEYDAFNTSGKYYNTIISKYVQVFCKYNDGRLRYVMGDGVKTYAQLANDAVEVGYTRPEIQNLVRSEFDTYMESSVLIPTPDPLDVGKVLRAGAGGTVDWVDTKDFVKYTDLPDKPKLNSKTLDPGDNSLIVDAGGSFV